MAPVVQRALCAVLRLSSKRARACHGAGRSCEMMMAEILSLHDDDQLLPPRLNNCMSLLPPQLAPLRLQWR